MANVVINDEHLTSIADAIRGKNGETTTYKPAEMADAITAIETGSETLETVTYIITPSAKSDYLDLSSYINHPDDLVALIWTCGQAINPNNSSSTSSAYYLYVYHANPIRSDYYDTREILAFRTRVTTGSSYEYYIASNVSVTKYGLDIHPNNLRVYMGNTTESSILSNAFSTNKTIVVTKSKLTGEV